MFIVADLASLMYCSKLHAWWLAQSWLALLLSYYLHAVESDLRQTLWQSGLNDLSIDEMVRAWCCFCCWVHWGLTVGFLLLRQGAASFVDLFLLFVFVFAILPCLVSCSLVVTCWERADLLALLFVMFSCHFHMRRPGSGVVLDCIDSWSLPSSFSQWD